MMTILPLAIGYTEILIIAGIIILLFGATKIPQLMRGMGKGISEFKKGMNEKEEDDTTLKQIDSQRANNDSTIDEQPLQ